MTKSSSSLERLEKIQKFCSVLGFDATIEKQHVRCKVNGSFSFVVVPEEFANLAEQINDTPIIIYSSSNKTKRGNVIGDTEFESLRTIKKAVGSKKNWRILASMMLGPSTISLSKKIHATKESIVGVSSKSAQTSKPTKLGDIKFDVSFETWLMNRKYQNSTVRKYIVALQKVGERLPNVIEHDLLSITNPVEFHAAVEKIKASPNYAFVNQKYGHGDLSAAMWAYTKYLQEMTTNPIGSTSTTTVSQTSNKSKEKKDNISAPAAPDDEEVLVLSCLEHIKKRFGVTSWKHVNKRDKLYQSEDDSIGVLCLCSKTHTRTKAGPNFWYGYHPRQKDKLEQFAQAYVVFAFKENNEFVLMPITYLNRQLADLSVTHKADGSMYWHVKIWYINGEYLFEIPNKGKRSIEEFAMHGQTTSQASDAAPKITEQKESEVVLIKIKSSSFKSIKKKH